MATTEATMEALVDFLRSEGTECGTGVDVTRLSDYEAVNKVTLPDDVRAYFLEVNGTNGDYACGIIRFWSLDEFATLEQVIGASGSRAAVIQSAYDGSTGKRGDYFVFADHMHEAQLYAIRLRPESEPNQVVVLDGGEPVVVAGSFTDFIRRYLKSPESLRLVVD